MSVVGKEGTRVSLVTKVFLVLAIVALAVWGTLSYGAYMHSQGAIGAVAAMNQAKEDLRTGNVQHGSAAYANFTSDRHTMNPYDHTICDNSTNFKDATGVSYTQGAQDARIVIDNNGRGGTCNHNNLPFRGAMHQACTHNLGGCGRISEH